jgi:hypothetical protein
MRPYRLGRLRDSLDRKQATRPLTDFEVQIRYLADQHHPVSRRCDRRFATYIFHLQSWRVIAQLGATTKEVKVEAPGVESLTVR